MKKITCCYFLKDQKMEEKLVEGIQEFNLIDAPEAIRNDVELVERFNSQKPCLAFVNCDAEGVNAAELLKLAPRPPFSIAITKKKEDTAELIDAGFFDVIDPKLDAATLCKKISKILNIIRYLVQNEEVREPLTAYKAIKSKSPAKSYTIIKHNKTHTRICMNDILYVRNTGNCLRIESCNGDVLYHNSTMKQFLSLLPEDLFVRINKSIIVNYSKIERFERGRVFVKKQEFAVSRAYIATIKDMFRKLG